MEVISSIAEWRGLRRDPLRLSGSLGFVPTMGALHEGHMALVMRSRAENERTLVSLFVNPTQFNDQGDLDRYPRPFESDCTMLARAGVDWVLAPSYAELYHDDYRYKVAEESYAKLMEGKHRPGHYDGVLTVVLKLLNIAGAHRAYFGEKDFQQYGLVRDMCAAFFVDTDIVMCPTVREADGLALSSRNRLLDQASREKAGLFYRHLSGAASPREARAALEREGFTVEYIEEHEGRRFGAVELGGVRLIDNTALTSSPREPHD